GRSARPRHRSGQPRCLVLRAPVRPRNGCRAEISLGAFPARGRSLFDIGGGEGSGLWKRQRRLFRPGGTREEGAHMEPEARPDRLYGAEIRPASARDAGGRLTFLDIYWQTPIKAHDGGAVPRRLLLRP